MDGVGYLVMLREQAMTACHGLGRGVSKRVSFPPSRERRALPYLLGGRQRPACRNCDSGEPWARFCSWDYSRFSRCASLNSPLYSGKPWARFCSWDYSCSSRCTFSPNGVPFYHQREHHLYLRLFQHAHTSSRVSKEVPCSARLLMPAGIVWRAWRPCVVSTGGAPARRHGLPDQALGGGGAGSGGRCARSGCRSSC